MNYWLHRISHHAELSYPLLETGYLSIGFSDMINNEIIDKVLSNDWDYFNELFQMTWRSIPKTRFNLWNFLKMAKGDLVIVPSWGTFFVCQIKEERPVKIGDAYFDGLKTWQGKPVTRHEDRLISESGNIFDLGFAWRVNVLHEHIPRDKFADSKLTSRMKIRQTNANITDIKDSIECSIDNYKNNKPIHLHSKLIEKTANIVLDTIRVELNPDKFEKLVKIYFLAIGANEVSIPPKNERDKVGDADIVAVFEHIKLIIYTQVKFQNGELNEWGTSQVLDYKTNMESIDDGYNKVAWVVTSGESFSVEAKRLATENGVQLINGLEFSKMLLNAGIKLLDSDL